MNTLHTIVWPGESAEYRAARNELLQMEIDLRRQTEAVAEKRRQLPHVRFSTRQLKRSGRAS